MSSYEDEEGITYITVNSENGTHNSLEENEFEGDKIPRE